MQHGHHAVGGVFLHTQHAQGRAALACAVKGGRHGIAHYLFHQGRGIDNHGVLATGFGNQHHGVAHGIESARNAALQDARHLGRAGEHHTHDALIRHQACTHGLALAGQ